MKVRHLNCNPFQKQEAMHISEKNSNRKSKSTMNLLVFKVSDLFLSRLLSSKFYL